MDANFKKPGLSNGTASVSRGNKCDWRLTGKALQGARDHAFAKHVPSLPH